MESAAPTEPGWLPAGEEPQPVGNITNCAVLRRDGISILSLPDGDIDCDREPGTGLYFRDTRYVSRLRLSFGGVPPSLLDAREVEGGLSAVWTNPPITVAGGTPPLPAQTLLMRRERRLEETLTDSLTVSNYGGRPVDVDLRVEFDADFQDIFAIRGVQRQSQRPGVVLETDGDRAHFCYDGADGIERRTDFRFEPRPAFLHGRSAGFVLHLEPGATADVRIEVCVRCGNHPGPAPEPPHQPGMREREWLATVTELQASDERVTGVFRRAMRDIASLRTRLGADQYVAAGVPWFDTLFGRDSLITGIELLPFAPGILRDALVVLSRCQASTTDPSADATPGKIAHELRWGELANIGEVPFGRYYGSVDVTPLFIFAAGEYLNWTGDIESLRGIWPALQRAMVWCYGALEDGDGFIRYERRSARGLENQGWKDSHDAIRWPDGSMVEPPIALVEVQAYLLAAFHAYARVGRALGDGKAADAEDESAIFAARFHEGFVDDALGYALCLDGKGRAVPTPASNTGHTLWCDAARPDLAARVASALLQPRMFSGWGIRTLSSDVTGFNPLGYHVGSVWPHDNALILHGLRRYGFDAYAAELADGLFSLAIALPEYRVPELLSGDARELRPVPTPYPVASRPHAWSAAAVPYVLASMLGLSPGGKDQLRIIRPRLPLKMDWLRLKDLRYGEGSVDLLFRRNGSHVSVEVEEIRSGIEVVLSQDWPAETGDRAGR
ncbi:MAG: amylo-alpha-1,6-glucosidase [Tepidiformaceae bacterium]